MLSTLNHEPATPADAHTSQIPTACFSEASTSGLRGDELLGDVALVAGLDDGPHDRAGNSAPAFRRSHAGPARRRCGSGRSIRGSRLIVAITSPSMICMW